MSQLAMCLGSLSPERNGAAHCLLVESLISCMSPPPCSGMVDFVEMSSSSKPHEVLARRGAGPWLPQLFGAKHEGDRTGLAVEEVPPAPSAEEVLQEQFVDITDPCFREVVDEESSYRGQVHPENGKFHGYGHYRCSEYAMVGRWENGLVHGSGHQAWTDGRTYDGQFDSGAFSGHGHYRCAEYTIVGQWQNGLEHGHGHQEWSDGRSFDGQFQSGSFHGHGRMQWQHARGVMVYEGEYKDDQKHGHGRFTWPSGRCYDGQWVNGQRHGVGDDIYEDGTSRRCVWEDNIAIHTVPTTEEEIPLSN